jgi:hypothetical protein
MADVVIWDDDWVANWIALSCTIADDTVSKKHGTNSMRILTTEETNGYFDVYRHFTSIDLSANNAIQFWWYGTGSGNQIQITFANGSKGCIGSFSDISGVPAWYLVTIMKSDMTPFGGGAIDWSDVDIVDISGHTTVNISPEFDYLITTAIPTWTLTIEAPIGNGTTDPPTGVITNIIDGTVMTLTATPDSGWGFDCWILNEGMVVTDNPISGPIGSSGTIMAIFYELPPAHGPEITEDVFDSSKWSMIGHTTSRSVMTSSSNSDIMLAGVGLKTNGVTPRIVTGSDVGDGTCEVDFTITEQNSQVVVVWMAGDFDLQGVYKQATEKYTDIIPLTSGTDTYESACIAIGTLTIDEGQESTDYVVRATANNTSAGISIAVYIFPPNTITDWVGGISDEEAIWAELDLDAGYDYFIFGAADGNAEVDGIYDMSTPTPTPPTPHGGGANVIASESLTEAQANAQREAQNRIIREREKRLQMEQK